MSKLLALLSVAAVVTACAGVPDADVGQADLSGPGAVRAADLGYHGPLHRKGFVYGN